MKVAFDALERAYGSIEDEANEAALLESKLPYGEESHRPRR